MVPWANDLRIPLYDFRTRGCNDGLLRDGVNTNQGAESTLSFLLSLLAIVESYAIIDKIQSRKGLSVQQAQVTGKIAGKPTPIKSIAAKSESKKEQVEELT